MEADWYLVGLLRTLMKPEYLQTRHDPRLKIQALVVTRED